jgi:hypothetical protein
MTVDVPELLAMLATVDPPTPDTVDAPEALAIEATML